jgi:tetratricopeptide (TPR) repeat protein
MPAYGTQVLALRLHAGGLEAIEPAMRQFAEQFPALRSYRAGLTLANRNLGREEAVREILEHVAAADFSDVPRDDDWLVNLACFAEGCAYLGDAQRAAALYDLLLPYARRNVVTNAAIACTGPIARPLGLLATTLGRWDEAESHFDEALGLLAKQSAKPYFALTQYDHAEMLRRRDRPGDRDRARALAEQALQTARALGMPYLER